MLSSVVGRGKGICVCVTTEKIHGHPLEQPCDHSHGEQRQANDKVSSKSTKTSTKCNCHHVNNQTFNQSINSQQTTSSRTCVSSAAKAASATTASNSWLATALRICHASIYPANQSPKIVVRPGNTSVKYLSALGHNPVHEIRSPNAN